MKNECTSKSLAEAVPGASPPANAGRQATLESRVLFAGGNEVVIFHYGDAYRLRQTRQGKLILTK
jgi:hemin uptake protein HemP